MTISVFDLFKIGIGPSSSHTVGPMVAARLFACGLNLDKVKRVEVSLYGSLGATGRGHGTDKAIILGLIGEKPDTVDVNIIPEIMDAVNNKQILKLCNKTQIKFNLATDLVFYQNETLDYHSNGVKFVAYGSETDQNDNQSIIDQQVYYSIGGGFVINEEQIKNEGGDEGNEGLVDQNVVNLPYPFDSADELLALCSKHDLSISEIMMSNEEVWRTREETKQGLVETWNAMQECVDNGCKNSGVLPGGLNVERRAAKLHQSLINEETHEQFNQGSMDWVNLYALAVNEENAAGGRVVTAPTNGAAGIIPAVMHYYMHFCPAFKRDGDDGIVKFLLTAGAIGVLIKKNASISGAEVGCQGEVGSACSMAAAGLTEVLGGTPEQIENAAEIGIEHNLGLTCDPIGGLVQVPCIERNAMGAVKAINASRMSLRSDGKHFVSLDKVIDTMRETGKDMGAKYKETARGGLAIQLKDIPVNIVEC